MKIFEKIMNWLGYEKINKCPDIPQNNNEPYRKNGIWYNVYDHITNDYISDIGHKEISEYWKIESSLAPAEIARLISFKENHKHPEDTKFYPGPTYWIGFGSGGGIGKCVYVKCEKCGKIYDITDESVW